MATKHIVQRLAVCALAVGLPSVATAQERSGFWVNFGIGSGSGSINAEDLSGRRLEGGRDSGIDADLGLGWALNRQLLVGVDIKTMAGTVVVDAERRFVIANVAGIVTYYPKTTSNLFLYGGVGGSFVDVDQDIGAGEQIKHSGGGPGFTIGAGYDVYFGRGFSLTPAVSYWYGRPGDLQVQGQTLLRNWRHNVVDIVVSIKFN